MQGGPAHGAFHDRDDFIVADDENVSDDGLGSERSSLTSITSSILKGVTENGRTYAAYGKEEYGMPIDERELDRYDLCHARYFILLDKKRFLAPVDLTGKRVLDLGTGTGIWCIDVADDFPSAEVIGVDIAPVQPAWIPPNCRFEIDDVEAEWTWQKESFDFIFTRDPLMAIRDFPRLIRQAFEHLKPGGWIEFQCIEGGMDADDGSLPDDSYYRRYNQLLCEAAAKLGAPLSDPGHFKEWFEQAGFSEAVEVRYKIPSNPWPKDERLKLLGAYELENFLTGLEGMSLRLFNKGLGWSIEETNVFLAGVRKDIRNRRYHAYWPFYVVYAQKPF